MGLFDDYVDARQFDSGRGLLGRLLALQQYPDQYRQGASVSQTSDVTRTLSPIPTLSPLLTSYGQLQSFGQSSAPNLNLQRAVPWPAPGTQDGPAMNFNPGVGSISPGKAPSQDFMAGGGQPSMGPAASAATPNTVLAQYFPARPVGLPIPPVFIPGSPENQAFVHSNIAAGLAIRDAIGNLLNSNNGENPVPGTTPEPETKGKSRIFAKPGGYDDAVKDFNDLSPTNVRPRAKGGLIGKLPNGSDVNVRPDSLDGRPTVEIWNGKKSIKTRYGDK